MGAFTSYVDKILSIIDHLPTYPLLTFMTEFPYCNWGENLHTIDISSTTYLVLSTHFVNESLIFICLVTQKYRVEELKVVITRLVSFMIERVIFFKQELFSKNEMVKLKV